MEKSSLIFWSDFLMAEHRKELSRLAGCQNESIVNFDGQWRAAAGGDKSSR